MSDLSQGPHRTGDNHHSLMAVGSARDGGEEILVIVNLVGFLSRIALALEGAHPAAHVGAHQVHLLPQGLEVRYEPERVNRS